MNTAVVCRIQPTPTSFYIPMMKSKIYSFGEFTYSAEQGLRRRSVPIRLTRQRQRLVKLLIEAAGEPVDHTKLGDGFFRGEPSPKSAALSLAQNVFWLRKVLADPTGSIVQTVLGRGYRLGVPVTIVGETPGEREEVPPSTNQVIDDVSPADPIVRSISRPANQNSNRDLYLTLTPDVFVTMAIGGCIRPADHRDRMIAAVTTPSRKPPDKPQDLAMLGWITGAVSGDVNSGLQYLKAALAGDPNSSTARFYMSWLLIAARQLEPALAELDSALAQDPSNAKLLFLRGWILLAMGKHQELDQLLHRALLHYPSHLLLRCLRSWSFALLGEFKKAKALLSSTSVLYPQSTFLVASVAWVHAVQGDAHAALGCLTTRHKTASGYMPATAVAAVYNALGDDEQASAYLGFAKVDQDPWFHLVRCDPRFGMRQEWP